MNLSRSYPIALAAVGIAAAAIWLTSPASAQSNRDVVAKSKTLVPSPPWAKGDQVGMANTLGPGTWMRCAAHLTNAKSKTYHPYMPNGIQIIGKEKSKKSAKQLSTENE